MTSLVCWFAVDSRKVSSVYVASDSRITAPDGRVLSDCSQKVFACRKRPDILGYCGNAERLPSVLPRLVSDLDAQPMTPAENAWARALQLARELNAAIPIHDARAYEGTTVVYASRCGEGYEGAAFNVFELHVVDDKWDFATVDWTDDPTSPTYDPAGAHQRMDRLDVAASLGSGARGVKERREQWASYHGHQIVRQGIAGTTRARASRGVFSGLCTALSFDDDRLSGGAPQLATIHQEGAASSLGVIWNDARFYEGRAQTIEQAIALGTRWHDQLFQLCDPSTMQALKSAAHHAAPAKGLAPFPASEPPEVRRARIDEARVREASDRERAREAHRKRFIK